MPIRNDYQHRLRWLDVQTGVSTRNMSVRNYAIREGWKSLKGESRENVLPYYGHKTKSSKIVRKGNPMITGVPGPTVELGPIYQSLGSSSFTSPYARLVVAKSWDKLMERVKGDTSSLGVAAFEARETFEMVAKRTTGLYRAYRDLKRGDFKGFLRNLSVDPKRKHRSKTRTASNEAAGMWLEYWFGWSPTVQDIGSAVYALTVNPVLAEVRESASAVSVLSPVTRRSGGWQGVNTIETEQGVIVVKQGGRFRLSNENLFLANRLGLVNPLAVAWELVPFSFVIDWFTKFGNVLEGFTDLAGLSYTHEYATLYATLDMEMQLFNPNQDWNRCVMQRQMKVHHRQKTFSRPLPIFPRIQNFGTSATRAATAVSLLTSIFLDGKLANPRL